MEQERDSAGQDDVDALNLLGQALELGIPEEALLQLIRVFADASARLADAQVRIFHDHVHEQFRASGLSGRQLLESTEAVGKPALALVEPAILYFHHRAWQQANRDDFLRHLAEATTPPAARPGDATAAVMFIDLAGFTPLTLALGDHGVADVLRLFSTTVREHCARHGGRIVKQIGDAFMLVFDRPAEAIHLGADLLRTAQAMEDLPGLHIGAHWGTVLYREGDYYGNGVNLAARIAASTDPDQFLVSTELAQSAGSQGVVHLALVPPRRLKGATVPSRSSRSTRARASCGAPGYDDRNAFRILGNSELMMSGALLIVMIVMMVVVCGGMVVGAVVGLTRRARGRRSGSQTSH